MHGYRIARRIEQVAGNLLQLNQGSIYPALIRLEIQGWIKTEWGVSETKRSCQRHQLSDAVFSGARLFDLRWRSAARCRNDDGLRPVPSEISSSSLERSRTSFRSR